MRRSRTHRRSTRVFFLRRQPSAQLSTFYVTPVNQNPSRTYKRTLPSLFENSSFFFRESCDFKNLQLRRLLWTVEAHFHFRVRVSDNHTMRGHVCLVQAPLPEANTWENRSIKRWHLMILCGRLYFSIVPPNQARIGHHNRCMKVPPVPDEGSPALTKQAKANVTRGFLSN